MNENWIIWKTSRDQSSKSVLKRYGLAAFLPFLAAFIAHLRPSLAETPHFIFLGGIVLSALYGGVGPAFLATTVCAFLVQIWFVHPLSNLALYGSSQRMECMFLFLLVPLMIGCLVSALRRERNLLRETEERYRMLADSASDAILVIDEKGKILFVNVVAEKMFETNVSPLLGQNMARLLPNSIYQPYLAHRDVAHLKKVVAFELPARDADRTNISLEMTLNACSKHGKRIYTAIIRDITGVQRPPAPASLTA